MGVLHSPSTEAVDKTTTASPSDQTANTATKQNKEENNSTSATDTGAISDSNEKPNLATFPGLTLFFQANNSVTTEQNTVAKKNNDQTAAKQSAASQNNEEQSTNDTNTVTDNNSAQNNNEADATIKNDSAVTNSTTDKKQETKPDLSTFPGLSLFFTDIRNNTAESSVQDANSAKNDQTANTANTDSKNGQTDTGKTPAATLTPAKNSQTTPKKDDQTDLTKAASNLEDAITKGTAYENSDKFGKMTAEKQKQLRDAIQAGKDLMVKYNAMQTATNSAAIDVDQNNKNKVETNTNVRALITLDGNSNNDASSATNADSNSNNSAVTALELNQAAQSIMTLLTDPVGTTTIHESDADAWTEFTNALNNNSITTINIQGVIDADHTANPTTNPNPRVDKKIVGTDETAAINFENYGTIGVFGTNSIEFDDIKLSSTKGLEWANNNSVNFATFENYKSITLNNVQVSGSVCFGNMSDSDGVVLKGTTSFNETNNSSGPIFAEAPVAIESNDIVIKQDGSAPIFAPRQLGDNLILKVDQGKKLVINNTGNPMSNAGSILVDKDATLDITSISDNNHIFGGIYYYDYSPYTTTIQANQGSTTDITLSTGTYCYISNIKANNPKSFTVHTPDPSSNYFNWIGSNRRGWNKGPYTDITGQNMGLITQGIVNQYSTYGKRKYLITSANDADLSTYGSISSSALSLIDQTTPAADIKSKGYARQTYAVNTIDNFRYYLYPGWAIGGERSAWGNLSFGTDFYPDPLPLSDSGNYDASSIATLTIKASDNNKPAPNLTTNADDILTINDSSVTTGNKKRTVADLKSLRDKFDASKKTIQSVKWLPYTTMDSQGKLLQYDSTYSSPIGGTKEEPTWNTRNFKEFDKDHEQGNAVIEITYGDGTTDDVPVIVNMTTDAETYHNLWAGSTIETMKSPVSLRDTYGINLGKEAVKPNISLSNLGIDYQWIGNTDINTIGYKPVLVKITYSNDDGSSDEIPALVHVINQATKFPPIPQAKTITTGDSVGPRDLIKNAEELEDASSQSNMVLKNFTWLNDIEPDLSVPGVTEAAVQVNYQDDSSAVVYAPIIIAGANNSKASSKYTPVGKVQGPTMYYNSGTSTVTDGAADYISNTADTTATDKLLTTVDYTWAIPPVVNRLDRIGNQVAVVKVTYDDQSVDYVPVNVHVASDASADIKAEGEDIVVPYNGTVDPKVGISNKGKLSSKVDYVSFLNGTPTTNYDYPVPVVDRVTYVDGSYQDVPTYVIFDKQGTLPTQETSNALNDPKGITIDKNWNSSNTENIPLTDDSDDNLSGESDAAKAADVDDKYDYKEGVKQDTHPKATWISDDFKQNATKHLGLQQSQILLTYKDKSTQVVTVWINVTSDAQRNKNKLTSQVINAHVGDTVTIDKGLSDKTGVDLDHSIFVNPVRLGKQGSNYTAETPGSYLETIRAKYADGSTNDINTVLNISMYDNQTNFPNANTLTVNVNGQLKDGTGTQTAYTIYAGNAITNAAALNSKGDLRQDGDPGYLPGQDPYVWLRKPDLTTTGQKAGVIAVNYEDGSQSKIGIEVNVVGAEDDPTKQPIAKSDVAPIAPITTAGQSLPDITNYLDTSNLTGVLDQSDPYEWVDPTDLRNNLSKQGTTTYGVIKVNYNDKNSQGLTNSRYITVKITTTGTPAEDQFNSLYTPLGTDMTVKVKTTENPFVEDNAELRISNADKMPTQNGKTTKYSWLIKPDITTAGDEAAVIGVTFPDNSVTAVPIVVHVTDMAENNKPLFTRIIQTMDNAGYEPSEDNAKDAAGNVAGTDGHYAFDTTDYPFPDTSKAGTYLVVIKVTYGDDGTIAEVPAYLVVVPANASSAPTEAGRQEVAVGEILVAQGQTLTGDTIMSWNGDPNAEFSWPDSDFAANAAKTPGIKSGWLKISYNDGSSMEEQVNVVVKDPNPKGQIIDSKPNPTGWGTPLPILKGDTINPMDGVVIDQDTLTSLKNADIPVTARFVGPNPGLNYDPSTQTYTAGAPGTYPEDIAVTIGTGANAATKVLHVSLAITDSRTDADRNNPIGQMITVHRGDSLVSGSTPNASQHGNAANAIANADNLSDLSETSSAFTWEATDASITATTGYKRGVVDIWYQDGNHSAVPVLIHVIDGNTPENDVDNLPQGQDVDTTPLQLPDLSKALKNYTQVEGVAQGGAAGIAWDNTNNKLKNILKAGTVVDGVVEVTYPDGAKRSTTVKIHVSGASDPYTDNVRYAPEGKDLTIKVNSELGAAKDRIKTSNDLPTTDMNYDWLTTPDVSTVGDRAAVIKLTYPDGTIGTVPIVVHVYDDASQRTVDPIGQNIVQKVNNPLDSDPTTAEKGIYNSDKLNGVSYSFKDTTGFPDGTKVGTYPEIVEVTYPDGSTIDVPMAIIIIPEGTDDATKNVPQFRTINVAHSNSYKLKSMDITNAITNASDIKMPTKAEWVSDNFATNAAKTVGMTSGLVHLSYGDGSKAEYNVNVNVYDGPVNDPSAMKHALGKTIYKKKADTVTAKDGIQQDLASLGATSMEFVNPVDLTDDGTNTSTYKIDNYGNYPELIKVTYGDGANAPYQIVQTTLVVSDSRADADRNAPQGQVVTVNQGTILHDGASADPNAQGYAAMGIANKADLIDVGKKAGTNYSYTWENPDLSTDQAGYEIGVVDVWYNDDPQSHSAVPVLIHVVGKSAPENDERYLPQGQAVTTTPHKLPELSVALKNYEAVVSQAQGGAAGITWKDATKLQAALAEGKVVDGIIQVTYQDGAKRSTTVKITVSGNSDPSQDSARYVSAGQDFSIQVKKDVDAAGNHIKNASAMPTGTTYTWFATPDTSTAGDQAAVIVVNFPDGSATTVPIVVHVWDEASRYQPTGQNIYREVGAELKDDAATAKSGIDTATSPLPNDVSYSFIATDNFPTTQKVGTYPVIIKVTYGDDQKSVAVPTYVVVTPKDVPSNAKDADKKSNLAHFKTINVKQGSGALTSADISSNISNLHALANQPTDFAWVNSDFRDNTAKTVGIKNGQVRLTFGTANGGDGSSKVYDVYVNVYGASDKPGDVKRAQGKTIYKKKTDTVTASDGIQQSLSELGATSMEFVAPSDLTDDGTNTGTYKIDNYGNYTETIKVTYGTEANAPYQLVQTTLVVSDNRAKNKINFPEGQMITVDQGTILQDGDSTVAGAQGYAGMAIANKADLRDLRGPNTTPSAGAAYVWDPAHKPTTTTTEYKAGIVDVYYSDGTKTAVRVLVNVVNQRTAPENDAQYQPQGQDITINVGETPQATAGIKNASDLTGVINSQTDTPKGIDWVDLGAITPYLTAGATVPGVIKVTYQDGASRDILVKIHVNGTLPANNDNNRYLPVGTDFDDVALNTNPFDDTSAETHIYNHGDMPSGTSYEWISTPDTSTIGDKGALIAVTFPDQTKSTVGIIVHVVDQASTQTKAPLGQTIYRQVGAALDDQPSTAAEGIANPNDMPQGTSYTFADTANFPTTAQAGSYPEIIKVTYPDGSSVEVPISIVVTSKGSNDAAKNVPHFKTINIKQGSGALTAADIADNISNMGNLTQKPDGFAWLDSDFQANAAKKVGLWSSRVRVSYSRANGGDGSSADYEVYVNVYGGDQDNPSALKRAQGQTIIGTVGKTVDPKQGIANFAALNASSAEFVNPVDLDSNNTVQAAGTYGETIRVNFGNGENAPYQLVQVSLMVEDNRAKNKLNFPEGQMITVNQGAALHDGASADPHAQGYAAQGIANKADLIDLGQKAGTAYTYTWENPNLSTKQAGYIYGVVDVWYNDDPQSHSAVPVLIHVVNDASSDENPSYIPQPQQITTDAGVMPMASQGIANQNAMPAGTNYSWADQGQPDVSQASILSYGIVKVTYPGGANTLVTVPVLVNGQADATKDSYQYIPEGQGFSYHLGVDHFDFTNETAQDHIINVHNIAGDRWNGLPSGTTYSWQAKADLTSVGAKPAVIKVTFPDHSFKLVPIIIQVWTDASTSLAPLGQNIYTKTNVAVTAASQGISNKAKLTNVTGYSFVGGNPDVAKAGSVPATIQVSYADNSTSEVPILVIVQDDFDITKTPTGGTIIVPLHTDLSQGNWAEKAIANSAANGGSLQGVANNGYTWQAPVPTTEQAGLQIAYVQVAFTNGPTVTVPVYVYVQSDASQNPGLAADLSGQAIKDKHVGDTINAQAGVKDYDQLSAAKQADFINYGPELVANVAKQAGTFPEMIKVTFDDGSSRYVMTTLSVQDNRDYAQRNAPKGGKMTVNPKYQLTPADAANLITNKNELIYVANETGAGYPSTPLPNNVHRYLGAGYTWVTKP